MGNRSSMRPASLTASQRAMSVGSRPILAGATGQKTRPDGLRRVPLHAKRLALEVDHAEAAVDRIHLRSGSESGRPDLELVGDKPVVAVQDPDVVPGDLSQPAVAIARDADI